MKKAFTLSEVMLVLSVIGVIAALTIPGIVQNLQNRQITTKVKNFYSLTKQYYSNVAADNDESILGMPSWSGSSEVAMTDFFKTGTVLKNCSNGTGCWYNSAIKYLNKTDWLNLETLNTMGKLIMFDGTLVAFNKVSNDCSATYGNDYLTNSVCAYIVFDINGAPVPNTLGKDVFILWVTRTGIYPAGIKETAATMDSNTCDLSSTGWACSSKAIMDGNFSY